MIPKKVAIITKLECDVDFSYTREAVKVLSECGLQVLINQNVKYRLGDQRDHVLLIYSERDLFETSDMIVVLGGDGTMLDVCIRASENAKPVVGVNLGNLGFLTAVERDKITALSEIANGNFSIEERMMLDVELTAKFTVHRQRVLNEVVIASGTRSKMGEFELQNGEEKLLGYRADGLIIATPTGSTAYSLSVGGPIIVPHSKTIAITPVAPHSLNMRPIVICDDWTITLDVESRSHNFLVAIDGRSESCKESTRLTISRADYMIKVIKRFDHIFFNTLRNKMMWGADIR